MHDTSCAKPATDTPNTTAEQQHARRRVRTPAVNITDSPEAVVILANLPGVDAKDVDISINGDELTIRGTLRQSQPAGFTLVHQEFPLADFERSFTLTHELDASKVEASSASGVVRISLPKVQAAQPRRIAVQTL